MFTLRKTESNIMQADPTTVNHDQSHEQIGNRNENNTTELKENQIILMQDNNDNRNDSHTAEYLDHPIELNELERIPKISKKMTSSYVSIQNRQKLPASLKQTLRRRAEQSGRFREKKSLENISNLGRSILSRFKKEEIACGICCGVMNEKDIVYLCECKHPYCKNCIRDYVTYKIKMYEQVVCPQEGCNLVMDQGTDFYLNLADEIKKQYVKVHNFYMTSNDPSLKLCPKENCEGIIKIIENQPRICNKCEKQFCPKCYFQKHEGNCDKMEIDFLQNNLHFRQCNNCKMVVERTEGCNHMTCKCKYEFCYVCGTKWTGYNHVCNQNQAQQQAEGGIFDEGGWFDCCTCCEQTCGETCQSVLLFPVKITLTLLFMSAFLMIFTYTALKLLFNFLISVVAGIFGFSIAIICELFDDEKCLPAILSIVFFPVTMIFGVFIGLNEMFCEMAGQDIRMLCELTSDACSQIWG